MVGFRNGTLFVIGLHSVLVSFFKLTIIKIQLVLLIPTCFVGDGNNFRYDLWPGAGTRGEEAVKRIYRKRSAFGEQ